MTLRDPAERSARGTAKADEITGMALPPPTTPFEESWRDFIFAEVWTRPALDQRARFLVALAGASIGHAPVGQLEHYVRGALRTASLSLSELREAALHLSVYAGWSKGGALDQAITCVGDELDLAPATCPPIRAEPWDPAVRDEEGFQEFTKVMTFPGGRAATPYLEAIRNFVFGEMWCRAGLDQRARRWLTLVGVCDSCADVPIKTHIWAAMASGNCTPVEMQEFVLAYGIHAGWPKASVIQGVVLEMIGKFENGLPWNG